MAIRKTLILTCISPQKKRPLPQNSTMTYTFSPPAKINLGLFIKGKRPDGYHILETLMYPLPQLADELEISEHSKGLSLEMQGLDIEGDIETNLCIKAFRLLQKQFPDLPTVHIWLKKNIPAGAGLGGGSSDAAATLTGMNTLFHLGLSMEELANMAAKLGADVPFFLSEKPMLATGIGTDLQAFEIDLPFKIELITPPIHSSTVAAYKALDYTKCDASRDLGEILCLPVDTWQKYLENDLEIPVFNMYPELQKIKAELYEKGAIYAAMSGSGSAVFGLFE